MMILFQNSISLEDQHMVTKFALRASLILQLYSYSKVDAMIVRAAADFSPRANR